MTAPRPDLVGAVSERLGVRVLSGLGRGGSGAASVLTRCGSGELAVLKIVTARPDAVDGHDIDSFRAKARQVAHLRRVLPELARHYPPLLAALDGSGFPEGAAGPDWAATLTGYAPGEDLVELAGRHGPDAAHQALRGIWSRLCALGYLPTAQPAPAGHGMHDFCDRLVRRRQQLVGNVPPELLGDGPVTVNGRPVAGFDAAARAAGELAGVFDAAVVAAPVHGDLNLRNVVATGQPAADGSFALLDPRGTVRPWNPVYDLAKVLFTLTVFDDLMAGGAQTERRPDGGFEVRLQAPRHRPWLARLLPDLGRMLAETGLAGDLAVRQLLLAHATHVLAESACRISDIGQPLPVRRNNATALLAYGLLLVADLTDRFASARPVSVADHLAVLEPA